MWTPPLSFLIAHPKREDGHQLQPEAEGEVPAPPPGQTYRSPPASPQEHLPSEERAEDHERGSTQEVSLLFCNPLWSRNVFIIVYYDDVVPRCPSACKGAAGLARCQGGPDLRSRARLMENLTDGPALYDVVSAGLTYSFSGRTVDWLSQFALPPSDS